MDLIDEINRCRHCGMCQAVCPLYQEEKEETIVARGKIRLAKLIEEGNMNPDKISKATFYNCLDCRACMDICPSTVNTSKIVKTMREKLYHQYGDNIISNVALEHLTPYPKRMNLARKSLHAYQTMGLPALVGLNPTLKKMEAVLPKVPKRSFRDQLPQIIPQKNGGRKVAYFISCTTNILYPKTGQAIIDVLTATGCEVFLMTKGTCCGVPQIGYGHTKRAREMALQNINAVPDDADFIVNDCATCGSALLEYREMFIGTEYAQKAARFAERVMDVSVFLANYAEIPEGQPLDLKITYHDPCHLVRGQGIRDEPRKLIEISGCELVEMKDADRCCGSAGTFNITHPNLSQKLLRKKIKNVMDTGAKAVATSCPACRMQITGGLKTYGQEMPVYHPVELLNMYINGKNE